MAESTFRWRTTWRLPHPESVQRNASADCQIGIDHTRWDHIIERHLQEKREQALWQEWLGQPIVKSLRDLTNMDPPKRQSILTLASQIVESGLNVALRRPLVMMQTEMGYKTVEKWNAVLPNGAMCCIAWFRRKTGIIQTLYFPHEAIADRHVDRRWKQTVKTFVMRYATRRTLTDRELPKSQDVVPVRSRSVFSTHIRYISPQQWGFDGDKPGAVWKEKRLKPWADDADATEG